MHLNEDKVSPCQNCNINAKWMVKELDICLPFNQDFLSFNAYCSLNGSSPELYKDNSIFNAVENNGLVPTVLHNRRDLYGSKWYLR